ncbi:MAG: Transglycosylase-like domain protein [Firmicutes bacterium ADurb.Bin506]|nr:MAG: Transglycosylase-like domain protein [Firmicutes bacterium ADurb.Bin506]
MTRARCIQWVQVAQCEAGGQQRRVTLTSIRQIDWRTNSTYDGGLQFKQSTWTSNMGRIAARHLTRYQRIQRSNGRYYFAYRAPSSVQILAAEVLRKRIGGNPHQTAGWPHCGAWFYA